MKKVLVAGGGLQAVSTARSLHDAGYEVGLWAPASDYSHKSTAISFRCDARYDDDPSRLIEFLRTNKVDAVLPMSDNYAALLSENKVRIFEESGCRACVPDYDQLAPAADKLSLMSICETNGLPHPRTVAAAGLTDNEIGTLRFPVLVKPNHSVGARGIVKVATPDNLRSVIDRVSAAFGECHVQEYVEGGRPYFNVMLYRDARGRCINYAILEIIRYYPLQGGSSSMCRTVDIPGLADLCMRLLDAIGYVGFADLDVLQTADGDFRIIEINPRVPASLRGAYVSGINFPALIVADTLGEHVSGYKYKPGKTLRYLGLDLMWFISSPDRFRSHPGWFRLWGRDIYYQEGGCADWKAMLASLVANFNKVEFKGGRLRKKTH